MDDEKRGSGGSSHVLQPAIGWSGVILNDLADDPDFPYELGGYEVGRATEREIDLIKSKFDLMIELIGHPTQPPYEATIKVDPEGHGVQFGYDLPRESWRYSVVRRTSADAAQVHVIDQALRVSNDDLRIVGWMFFGEHPAAHSFSIDYVEGLHWQRRSIAEYAPQVVSLPHLKEVYGLWCVLDEKRFSRIAGAMHLFAQLDELSDRSDAKMLGHFSILENLLTHKPEPGDPVDSITRQLKRNLKLIDHRLPSSQNLGLSRFSRDATADQVISRLYGIRSAIAHGGRYTKDLEWLNERRPPMWGESPSVNMYIRRIVQRVIVAALREPQLISDLAN
jgi:hypothetical protein